MQLTYDFVGSGPNPASGVLSHTWEPDHEEITYKDLMNGDGQHKVGFQKLRFCADQVRTEGLECLWIDTCCNGKSNNSELQEAITAMFRWYRIAQKCCILRDYTSTKDGHDRKTFNEEAFKHTRWFTRDWTSSSSSRHRTSNNPNPNGRCTGSKSPMEISIPTVTGIPPDVLRGRHLAEYTTGERLTWAVRRTTGSEENRVYSLFGIFGVTMPLMYGEGRERDLKRVCDGNFE